MDKLRSVGLNGGLGRNSVLRRAANRSGGSGLSARDLVIVNTAPKMQNNDRSADNETDRERLEDLATKEPIDDDVPFVETLDAQTRAELDEVLERSTMLVRDVIAALYRR